MSSLVVIGNNAKLVDSCGGAESGVASVGCLVKCKFGGGKRRGLANFFVLNVPLCQPSDFFQMN